jgi:hypothetical protein
MFLRISWIPLACAAALSASLTGCSALVSPGTVAAPVTSAHVLRTVAPIMGEPNFSVDGAYQELEEGLYTQLDLRPDGVLMAPLGDIVAHLGGRVPVFCARRSGTAAPRRQHSRRRGREARCHGE